MKFIFLITLLISHLALSEEKNVQISVGSEQVLEFGNDIVTSVQISRSGIVDVNKGVDKSKIFLKGLQPGETQITFELSDKPSVIYKVTVAAKNVEPGKNNGIGSNTYIRTINKLLNENDIPNIQAHAYGKYIVLEGSPKDPAQKEMALRIAKNILPDIEDRVDTKTNGAPAISIEVLFVEAQRKNKKELGTTAAQMMTSTEDAKTQKSGEKLSVAPSLFLKEAAGAKGKLNWHVGPLVMFLKLIQEKALSRVLSNPKLVTRSAQEATFFSGGKFFITNREYSSSDKSSLDKLYPIETGISLKVKPTLDPIGQIDSLIETAVSDVAAEIANNPSVTESKVATAVTIKSGQSILLSGLTRKVEKKRISRIPILADIPVVGELFKSRDLSYEENELIIVVTMSKIDAEEDARSRAVRFWDQEENNIKVSFFD